jgi:acyl-CoA thioesterase
MSYLDKIRQMGRDANPFLASMGIEVVSFGDGKAELLMGVRPGMLNGAGWMQGGIFTALADEAMALALSTALGEDDRIATISESTSFLQGVRDGKVRAQGQVVRLGRQVAFTEGLVKLAEGSEALLSKTVASFAIFGGQKAKEAK